MEHTQSKATDSLSELYSYDEPSLLPRVDGKDGEDTTVERSSFSRVIGSISSPHSDISGL